MYKVKGKIKISIFQFLLAGGLVKILKQLIRWDGKISFPALFFGAEGVLDKKRYPSIDRTFHEPIP